MKKQLQIKLYAIIVTAMMFSVCAKAQIVYTDIIPDSAYTLASWGNDTFNLDLNNDSTIDFLIIARRPRPRYPEDPYTISVSITPQADNAFMTTTLHTIKKLVPDDAIRSNQEWHGATLQYLKWFQVEWVFTGGILITNIGDWDNVVNGYVGLRLASGDQTYYGWVRMDVNVSIDSASMTIKDYAYNSIPNQPILAGETMTTGIVENSFATSVNLFPNPASNHLTIDLGSNHKKVQISIADITGKVVFTTLVTDTQKVEVNTNDFAAGIYVVLIQAADFTGTRTIIVEK